MARDDAVWRRTLGRRGRRPLETFCARYGRGYTIRWCPLPALAPDALGERGAAGLAQLCAGNVIAATPGSDSLHAIAHEIGHAEAEALHGQASFDAERGVLVEQIAFLVQLSTWLMRDGGVVD